MTDREWIQVARPSMPTFEEYCEEIRDLWESRWLTNMGAKHDALQRALEAYLGVPHVTLCTNGHLALENALAALRLPRGSEVITTPYTFASTTHAILRSGLVPVFCDIRPDDFTMDAGKIEPLITERTAAILPVHVYGNVCDVEGIGRVAERHGLRVIYDAAHAFGVRVRGASAASFGDAAILSFHATKVFNTIEGGAVCYRDDAWAQPLDDLKNFGIRGPEEVACAGGNAKMSEFQAAMGLCNLRHIDGEIARRRAVHERYIRRLSHAEGLRLPEIREGVEGNYAYFPVLFDGFRLSRDEAQALLERAGIVSRKYFYPLTSACPCYEGLPTACPERTPVARYASNHVLTLPLYADLRPEDVDRICDILLSPEPRGTNP